MIDYSNASFTPDTAHEIMSRAMEYADFKNKTSLPDSKSYTMQQLLDAGKEAGLSLKVIETTVDAYFDEQVIRRSNITKTRITEERVLDSEADKEIIWQQVISEIIYRMGDNPVIRSLKNKDNQWILSDRTGKDTIIKLNKNGKRVKLLLSRKISYAGPVKESFAAGWTISLIIGINLMVFVPISTLTFIVTILLMMVVLPLLIKKILVKKREKRIRQFERLTEQITEQIPRFKVSPEKQPENEIEPNKGQQNLFSIRKSFTKRDTRF